MLLKLTWNILGLNWQWLIKRKRQNIFVNEKIGILIEFLQNIILKGLVNDESLQEPLLLIRINYDLSMDK